MKWSLHKVLGKSSGCHRFLPTLTFRTRSRMNSLQDGRLPTPPSETPHALRMEEIAFPARAPQQDPCVPGIWDPMRSGRMGTGIAACGAAGTTRANSVRLAAVDNERHRALARCLALSRHCDPHFLVYWLNDSDIQVPPRSSARIRGSIYLTLSRTQAVQVLIIGTSFVIGALDIPKPSLPHAACSASVPIPHPCVRFLVVSLRRRAAYHAS